MFPIIASSPVELAFETEPLPATVIATVILALDLSALLRSQHVRFTPARFAATTRSTAP